MKQTAKREAVTTVAPKDALTDADKQLVRARVSAAVERCGVNRVHLVLDISRAGVGSITAGRAADGTMMMAWLRLHRLESLSKG